MMHPSCRFPLNTGNALHSPQGFSKERLSWASLSSSELSKSTLRFSLLCSGLCAPGRVWSTAPAHTGCGARPGSDSPWAGSRSPPSGSPGRPPGNRIRRLPGAFRPGAHPPGLPLLPVLPEAPPLPAPLRPGPGLWMSIRPGPLRPVFSSVSSMQPAAPRQVLCSAALPEAKSSSRGTPQVRTPSPRAALIPTGRAASTCRAARRGRRKHRLRGRPALDEPDSVPKPGQPYAVASCQKFQDFPIFSAIFPGKC